MSDGTALTPAETDTYARFDLVLSTIVGSVSTCRPAVPQHCEAVLGPGIRRRWPWWLRWR